MRRPMYHLVHFSPFGAWLVNQASVKAWSFYRVQGFAYSLPKLIKLDEVGQVWMSLWSQMDVMGLIKMKLIDQSY